MLPGYFGRGGSRQKMLLMNFHLKCISMVILEYSGYKNIFLKNNFNCSCYLANFLPPFMFIFSKNLGGGGR